jgi:iduronate 2-sulfatase
MLHDLPERIRRNRMTWCRSVWLAVLLAGLGLVGSISAAEDKKLNVLFLAVDDLRTDLGCYGHPLVKTPHIDRLAARGTTFLRAYCQQALCNPSRASLLTGRRPDSLGIWNLTTHFRETHPGVLTLPQQFKEQGYHTQGIGKVFHNWRTRIKGDPLSWSTPAVMHFATHGSDTPQVKGPLPPSTSKAIRTECRDVPDQAYFDGRIADLAVQALRQHKDKPFFLAVGFWKPHLPFNAPKKYWDLYDRARVSLPAHPRPPLAVPKLALHNSRELLGTRGRELSPEEIRELRHGYYAAISYLDAQVGKVLGELKRLGLEDNTVVVFWSDHGFHLGEHGLWCKTSNFELDARVPLIIALPHPRHPGARTDALVELLDLYPTLTDLCGLPAPNALEGVPLKPVLMDPRASVKPAAYTQHPRPAYYQEQPQAMGYSVRTDRFRYTEWRDWKTGKVVARELYDHRNDPAETRNVIADPPQEGEFERAVRLLHKQFPVRKNMDR